jgi:hypothetical protein
MRLEEPAVWRRVGRNVALLTALGLATPGLVAAATQPANALASLGGGVVHPAPAFPIRAAGQPVVASPPKSHSPRATLAASLPRQPSTRVSHPFLSAAAGTHRIALARSIVGTGNPGARPTAPRRRSARRSKIHALR